jgi:hypothetical protein
LFTERVMKEPSPPPRHAVSAYRRIVKGKVQMVRRYERMNRGSSPAAKDKNVEPTEADSRDT